MDWRLDWHFRRLGAAQPANFLFLILYLPFGILSGYVSVTLEYELSQAGVTTAAIAAIVGLNLLPQIWKFLWAVPLDTHFTYRGWHAISTVLTAAGMAAMALIPAKTATLPILSALVLIVSVANTVVSMTTDALVAHSIPDDHKGRAAGWSQAGNIGGTGLGGGLGLWLAAHSSPLAAAVVVAFATVACLPALFFVPEPEHTHRAPRFVQTLNNLRLDVWAMARSRVGLLAMVLLVMPLGTGAAANLWAGVAQDWHAGADIVAIVAGVVGGLVSTVGCLIAGRFCDLADRKTCYIVSAAMMALCAIAMAAAPRTPSMFVFFALLYALINGFMYATFGAVMLEAIGRGAAATKSPIMGGLTNIPIWVMTNADGWARTEWGSGAMLVVEGVVGILAIGLFYLFATVTRPRVLAVQAEAA